MGFIKKSRTQVFPGERPCGTAERSPGPRWLAARQAPRLCWWGRAGSVSRHPISFADSNALLAYGQERSHELSFIPNFLLLCSSLENTSAGHCIWGFVQDFAVGLPLQHPTASAPPMGMGCQGNLSFHRGSAARGAQLRVFAEEAAHGK